MEFDNQENLYNLKKTKMIVGMFFVPLIVLIIADSVEFHYISLPWYLTVIPVVLLYVLFLYYWKKREYSYLNYSDVGDFLIFKFFKMDGLFKKATGQMIKIPKKQFYKFEIDERVNREKLILHQKVKDKVHEYPYISISALSKQQREDLKQNLNRYAGKKS